MSRQTCNALALFLAALVVFSGCHPTQPFYFRESGDLSSYLDRAIDVEYPDVQQASLAEVTDAHAPFTLTNPEFREIWDLSLEECISIALHNSKAVRSSSSFRSSQVSSEQFLSSPQSFTTIYDPAMIESDGQFGVEAALAEFDAQLSGSIIWEKTDRPQNRAGFVGFPTILRRDTNQFQAEISKKAATGTQLFFRNVTDYDRSNAGGVFQPLSSFYTTAFEMEVNQPLFRGRGTQVNRVPTVIARINTDLSLADFEAAVRNLVMDVENAYWDLHCSYRTLETAKKGRDSALTTWRIVYEKWKQGVEPVQAEAQSREQYFSFRAQVEGALGGDQSTNPLGLYTRENRLRWLMGLAATDGRLIRPSDEPTTASMEFDWQEIHAESMARTAELRKQSWIIKQRELELILARNQLLPQVNAVALYRWLGSGDELVSATRNGFNFPAVGSRAFDELTEGKYHELRFGVEATMPIGFRAELAGVRNAQLSLVREKARLEDMELTVSHLLTEAVRNLDSHYQLAQTHFNRWVASEKEVESVEALYKGGKATLDLVLDAQRRLSDSQNAYYRALCEYSKFIAFVHFRKGSLLEYNDVYLAEGPWPQKAYWDALGLARKRDAATYMDYGWSRPNVVSRGVAVMIDGEGSIVEGDAGLPDEMIPAPQPTPADPPMDWPPLLPADSANLTAPPTVPQSPALSASGPVLAAPVLHMGTGDATMTATDEPLAEVSAWDRSTLSAAGTSVSRQIGVAGPTGFEMSPLRTNDEPVTHQPAGEAHRTASGWTRSQR